MKTALCLSGLVRNYHKYIDHWVDFIKYWNCDVFIHTWDVFDQVDRKEIDIDNYNNIAHLYRPLCFAMDRLSQCEEFFKKYNKWDFKKEHWHSKDAQNFACMYFSIFQSHDMLNTYMRSSKQNYDVIFRARFDFGFKEQLKIEDINTDKLNLLPINRDDGYCDIFAAGKPEHMNIYSDLFINYDECCANIKLMRPEDMLKYWIDKHNIPVNIINNKYLIK